MKFVNNLKEKFLKRSDSYNYYKNESEILSKDLKNEIESLKGVVKSYEKELDKCKANNNMLNSHQFLLNTLYVDYELTPKGALKYTFDLSTELMYFTYNICKKHNLKFWLEAGTALGAIRHSGFIPFDDDIDVAMIRSDYMKFNDIVQDEIKLNNLEDIVTVDYCRYDDNLVNNFTKMEIKIDDTVYACVDIFPYDYIKDIPENIEKTFREIESSYHLNILNGIDETDALDAFYEEYGFTYEEQDFIFPCIHAGWAYSKFELHETNRIFPLKEAEFYGKKFPIPNDINYYLSQKYGENLMELPKTVITHNHVKELKKVENYDDNFKKFIKKIKDANEKFI